MISLASFTKEHIFDVRQQNMGDPALIERMIFAFGLLEALARSKLPFLFKGGTSLMLLLNRHRRFSTDIDIVVDPGIDAIKYIEIAASIWPFFNVTEHLRSTGSTIEKRHFKLAYTSPLTGEERTILLDIVFEKNPYSSIIEKSIENEVLLTEPPPVFVRMPSINCILADKLTAFAPHTSGIPYGEGKEMEIIKQLYDISELARSVDDFSEMKANYTNIVKTELRYRSIDASPEVALRDTIETAACIAGRGQYRPAEYQELKKGIASIRNHIFAESFNGEVAVQRACVVMCLAAAVLSDADALPSFKDDNYYATSSISLGEYNKLGYIRKMDLLAYKYLVEALAMLSL